MDPLATPDDLLERLALTAWDSPEEELQAEKLLADASGEMRAIVGNPITPTTSTVLLWPSEPGSVTIPGQPIIEILQVSVDGASPIAAGANGWRLRRNQLYVPGVTPWSEVTVTYRRGWDPVPDEIKTWTCVLAAGSRSAVENMGALGQVAGIGQYSEAIEEISSTWTTAQMNDGLSGLTLPLGIQARLKRTYGDGG